MSKKKKTLIGQLQEVSTEWRWYYRGQGCKRKDGLPVRVYEGYHKDDANQCDWGRGGAGFNLVYKDGKMLDASYVTLVSRCLSDSRRVPVEVWNGKPWLDFYKPH